ncbi:MAG: hypothetical protein LIO96_12505 [Lachnospiraceae bacterium]|nr:hypothetical protein [Lachnospiraceae bacterium]
MDAARTYILDGMELHVPLRVDMQPGRPIEDYREWIENIVYTPSGYRVMFSGTDACIHAEEVTPGGCPDCGSCRFYRRAAEQTWIGMCVNVMNQRRDKMPVNR